MLPGGIRDFSFTCVAHLYLPNAIDLFGSTKNKSKAAGIKT